MIDLVKIDVLMDIIEMDKDANNVIVNAEHAMDQMQIIAQAANS